MKQPIPYEFGIQGRWHSLFDLKESHIKRLKKLIQSEEKELILEVCRHYIAHFIPNPVRWENQYWIISCYPSTDKSLTRISIWFPEVFKIAPVNHDFRSRQTLQVMIFVHTDFIDTKTETQLKKKVSGLFFVPGYRFVTGIKGQLAAFMPLHSYFDFVKDETVYESIRAHNYELTLKGQTPFKKGHNHEFVRYLFGEERYLSMM